MTTDASPKHQSDTTRPSAVPAEGFGLYVHWPFCERKCPYCDFNSHVRDRVDHEAMTEGLLRELNHVAAETGGRALRSIFFGGGTPSLMPPMTVARIIERAEAHFRFEEGIEITLEANPTSSDASRFHAYRLVGVNRLSLGVQSLIDDDLEALGRLHDADQAKRAIQLAHATFERTSFDLIYARAGQTPDAWYRELGEALDLTGGHLSCYQLTLEPGTLFHSRFMRGQLVLPTDEVQAELYLITQDLTRGFGLNAYEVSNYARPGEESAHNLIYWRYGDYAGIGPGAHGRLTLGRRRIATETRKAPEDWLKAVRNQGHGERPRLDISRRDQVIEALLMGLRLEEGIPWRRLERLSERPRAEIFAPDMLAELVARGWIDEPLRVLRVSSAGRLLLNRVIDRLTDELLIS